MIYCGNQHFATLSVSSAELVMKLEHFFMIRYNYCHGTGLKWYTVVFIHNFGRKPPWSKLWTHKGKTKFRCSHFSTYTCDIPLDYWVAFIINKRSPAKEGFKIWSNIPCLEKDQMPQKSSLISIDHDMLSNQNPYLHAILCEPGRLDLITLALTKTSWLGCHRICCVGVCVRSVCQRVVNCQVPHASPMCCLQEWVKRTIQSWCRNGLNWSRRRMPWCAMSRSWWYCE